MSSSSKPILRQQVAKPKTESVSLPKWDRAGNLVTPAARQRKPVQVDDVESKAVKPPTVAELEAIREQAYNEGFEQGYEQGMDQGARKGEQDGHAKGLTIGEEEGRKLGEQKAYEDALKLEQAETQKRLELYDSLTLAMTHQLAAEEQELKDAMLALSMRIARQVLQDELQANPEHIQNIVHAAIQALPNPDEKLSVQVNISDAELVRSIAESHWKVEINDAVSPGGCLVKSGYSYIDYTLEHRFNNAVTHLMNNPERPMPEKAKQPLSSESLLNPPGDSEAEAVLANEKSESDAADTATAGQPETQLDSRTEATGVNAPANLDDTAQDDSVIQNAEEPTPAAAKPDDLSITKEAESDDTNQ